MECEDNIHDWEHSSWGVIIGVSKCKKCGKVAKEEDFNKTGRGEGHPAANLSDCGEDAKTPVERRMYE